MKICKAEDCNRERVVKGLCTLHYARLKRLGSLELPKKEVKFCDVAGCSKVSKAPSTGGPCPNHYAIAQRLGDVGLGQICLVDECEKISTSNGLCKNHYSKSRRDEGKDKKPPIEQVILRGRFNDEVFFVQENRRVSKHGRIYGELSAYLKIQDFKSALLVIKNMCNVDSNECWNYPALTPEKYGKITIRTNGKSVPTHRFTYSLSKNISFEDLLPMPVHHKCSNRQCCNPEHLQQITIMENTAEMFERKSYLSKIAELEGQLSGALLKIEELSNKKISTTQPLLIPIE